MEHASKMESLRPLKVGDSTSQLLIGKRKTTILKSHNNNGKTRLSILDQKENRCSDLKPSLNKGNHSFYLECFRKTLLSGVKSAASFTHMTKAMEVSGGSSLRNRGTAEEDLLK